MTNDLKHFIKHVKARFLKFKQYLLKFLGFFPDEEVTKE